MAGLKDYTLQQGATFSQVVTFAISGSGVDLTGATVRMDIRSNVLDEVNTLYTSASTTNGRIVLADQSTNPGRFTITIPASITDDLDWPETRPARYDIEVETAGGTVYRILQGLMFMSKQVTD